MVLILPNATPTGNDGTNNATNNLPVGKIAGAKNFNGSTSYVHLPTTDFNPCNGNQTISIWARYPSIPGIQENLISFQDAALGSATQVGFIAGIAVVWKWGGAPLVSSGSTLSSKHLALLCLYFSKWDCNSLYIDGTLHTDTPVPQTAVPVEGTIGRYNSGGYFNGDLDEARYSTVSRSAGWITTEYKNQNDQLIGAGHFINSISAETQYNSASNYLFEVCTGGIVTYSLPSRWSFLYLDNIRWNTSFINK